MASGKGAAAPGAFWLALPAALQAGPNPFCHAYSRDEGFGAQALLPFVSGKDTVARFTLLSVVQH